MSKSFAEQYHDARNYIVTRDWPKGLIIDLRPETNEFGLEQLYLVFYRDNWLTLSPRDHLLISELVKETIEKLRADGIPISFGTMEASNGGTGLA